MVAKINRGASLYRAIIYNQQKVNEDTARIIAGNRMITDSLYDPDRFVRQTMFAFESYLTANCNTKKPILHISPNPTLDDNLTDSQFVDLARTYMQKMSYVNQPYIVYLHEDIDRRHIHIVSTCVNENGEKRYKGREESEDDLAEDLCDLPRRSCTLLYELVVARSAVLANREYDYLYGYYDYRIYPSSYVYSMD